MRQEHVPDARARRVVDVLADGVEIAATLLVIGGRMAPQPGLQCCIESPLRSSRFDHSVRLAVEALIIEASVTQPRASLSASARKFLKNPSRCARPRPYAVDGNPRAMEARQSAPPRLIEYPLTPPHHLAIYADDTARASAA